MRDGAFLGNKNGGLLDNKIWVDSYDAVAEFLVANNHSRCASVSTIVNVGAGWHHASIELSRICDAISGARSVVLVRSIRQRSAVLLNRNDEPMCHRISRAGLTCCPSSTAAGGCNVPWYLDRALSRVGHFDHMTTSSEAFTIVRGEIGRGGRPMGARVAWASSGAHFTALAGWSVDASGTEYLDVEDPFYGPTTATYGSFTSNYRSPGDSWTHSYFTNVAPAAGSGVIAGAPLSA